MARAASVPSSRDMARRHGLCGSDARRRHVGRRADGEGSQAFGCPRMTFGDPFNPPFGARLSASCRSARADEDWCRPQTTGSTKSRMWPERSSTALECLQCCPADPMPTCAATAQRPLKRSSTHVDDRGRLHGAPGLEGCKWIDRAVHLRARHTAQQGKFRYFGEQETTLAGKRKRSVHDPTCCWRWSKAT